MDPIPEIGSETNNLWLLIVMNHGTISKTVPWLKSVTFIEP